MLSDQELQKILDETETAEEKVGKTPGTGTGKRRQR